jgi:hypothetical protein
VEREYPVFRSFKTNLWQVPGKRNRKLEVLGLDLSGNPTYQALDRKRDRFAIWIRYKHVIGAACTIQSDRLQRSAQEAK